MGQIVGFDVAVDKEIATPFLHNFQTGTGKRNIEFDFERRRSQYGATDFRRVIVQPSRNQYRTNTLCNHADVFRFDAVFALNVSDKIIYISNRSTDTRTIAAFTRAVTMTARVPSKIGKIIKT